MSLRKALGTRMAARRMGGLLHLSRGTARRRASGLFQAARLATNLPLFPRRLRLPVLVNVRSVRPRLSFTIQGPKSQPESCFGRMCLSPEKQRNRQFAVLLHISEYATSQALGRLPSRETSPPIFCRETNPSDETIGRTPIRVQRSLLSGFPSYLSQCVTFSVNRPRCRLSQSPN